MKNKQFQILKFVMYIHTQIMWSTLSHVHYIRKYVIVCKQCHLTNFTDHLWYWTHLLIILIEQLIIANSEICVDVFVIETIVIH